MKKKSTKSTTAPIAGNEQLIVSKEIKLTMINNQEQVIVQSEALSSLASTDNVIKTRH